MTSVIIPLMTMLIGFMLGKIATDSVGENRKIADLERKVRRLESLLSQR